MKITIGNGQFFADGFAIRRSFTPEEGETRLISYVSEVGCGAAIIRVTDGDLSTEGRIGVIRWSWGAELYPLPCLRPWEDTAETTVTVGAGKATITVRGGDPALIRVTGAHSYEHVPARGIYAPRISLIEGQRFPILRIDAKCDVGEYLSMLALREGGCAPLLEEVGDRILSEGNLVRIERQYEDTLRRHATTEYLWRGDRFDRSAEIRYEAPRDLIREERGFALLEAVAARDIEGIEALLAPEIRDAEGILGYFGEVIAVRPATGTDSPTAAATITRDDKGLRGRIYDFDFDESGRIRNVRNEE